MEGDLKKPEADVDEDFEQELQASSSVFEALERDFQEVLSDLLVDESLEKFRIEYEKLHRALKKSHEQEKRLVKKCRELNTEILSNQAKIKTALRLSQDDQKTIAHLQKEMEKTWKVVYSSQEKESKSKETIANLREEMVNLIYFLSLAMNIQPSKFFPSLFFCVLLFSVHLVIIAMQF
jgi:hypothetical protein